MAAVPTDDDAGAAAARRRIGRILTELREKARTEDGKAITVEQAAQAVELARPTMWRIEHGRDGVQLKNIYLNTLCNLYGASDEVRKDLLDLAILSRRRGWFHPYSDVMPVGFGMYLSLEAAAEDITAYETDRVHGLMQTEDYAREMVRIPGLDGRLRDDEEVARRVQVRLRRQAILTRTSPAPVKLHWILGEAALRHRVGTAAMTARQLDHINEHGELPNVSVRVIPFEVGLHQGVAAGPFARLRFADNTEPPTVYADGFLGILLMSKPAEVRRFDVVITGMRSCALDEQKSRDLIHRIAKEHLRA